MKPNAYALSFVALLLTAGSASADYCINKDIIKLGTTPAYDLAIRITGNQPVTWRYDGVASNNTLFSTFTNTPSGTSEILHWSNLMGTDQPISNSVKYHVGWCTKTPNNIIEMYWTDENGNRVPKSVVCQTGAHSSNNSTPGVQWNNVSAAWLNVNNATFAVSKTAWNLAELNRENRVLASQLAPLPGGESLPLEPGATVELAVPGAVRGDWVVIVHDVSCPGSQAVVRDFVQFQF